MSFGFGFSLPSWQALSGGFSPASLFSGGTVAGAWYDPSDLSTLFDSSTGTTPVSMPGQGAAVPVGLMLDKSQGLVLGSELVTNGDFSSGTTGWSAFYSSGTGSLVVSGGVATLTAGTGYATAGQSITTVVGKWYRVTGTVTSAPNSGFNAFRKADQLNPATNIVDFVSTNSAITSPTTATGYFLATSTTSWVLFQVNAISGSISFDNISVRELPGNHAISFNNTTARPELRARVNLLERSEEFDNAYWSKATLNVINAAGAAPNGTNTANKVYTTTTGTYRGFNRQITTIAISYVATIFAKAAEKNIVGIVDFNGGAGAAWFNLSTGVASNVAPGYVAAITSAGNGWYQCSITGTASAGTGYYQIFIADAVGGITATVNGTDGVFLWGADLRPANIGANVPAYQRIADALTYDTSGFPLYLLFEGAVGQRGMYTPANLNLSGTDKVAVFAGVRKLADTRGSITELSADAAASNGSFNLFASVAGAARWFSALRGTAFAYYEPQTYTAPITNVLSTSFDIAGASISNEIVPRVNGIVEQDNPSGANAGTGNFGTYPLYIGSRNNSSDWFNGQVYGLLVVGSAVSAGNISATEQWVAGKTGIAI